MIPHAWLVEARNRIAPYILKTPLTYDAQRDIYLKWENHQVTGSFKARGSFNKIYSLQEWELQRGLVTASAGNHGQGVALAGNTRGSPTMVFASDHASQNKIQAMQSLGAHIQLVAGAYGEAERAAIDYAKTNGAVWVSPYNDGMVIAGQGTIGLEILDDLPDLDIATWIVPVGGGGLISGIGSLLLELHPRPGLIGVQSEASPFMHAIYHSGTQTNVVELPSLADGLAGAVEEGSVTIPMVVNSVSDMLLVSEDEIRAAIKYAWITYHEVIEGSAAASLAAVLFHPEIQKPALVVITGGNIGPNEHERIINDPTI